MVGLYTLIIRRCLRDAWAESAGAPSM